MTVSRTLPVSVPPSLRLSVDGMDCPSCALKIEAAIRRLPGVEHIDVNVTGGSVSIFGADDVISADHAIKAIERLGFSVRRKASANAARPAEPRPHRPWWKTSKGRIVLTAGGLLAIAFVLGMLFPSLNRWPFVLATLVGLLPIARTAFAAARSGSFFTIEMLMTIAAVGALAIDAAEEAAVVVFLFAVGELLEGVAASKARKSIGALSALTPKTALLLEGGAQREVLAESLTPGQMVLVRPGDRIPCDGEVAEGASEVNEAPVTGESVPKDKSPGEPVFAGTVNLSAVLKVTVTKAAADNTIARIIRLVEEAQESKATVQRFIDRFARIYMPVMVGIAALVAVTPPLVAGEPWGTWIYRALALLLIACPCALVISTPAAIAAGLSTGARRGLLIKGGAVLEAIGKLRTIAFDKTGTLTSGTPKVTDVQSVAASESQTLKWAAALEAGSNHPIATAVLAHARRAGIAVLPVVQDAKAIAGHGLTGRIDGRDLFLGNPRSAETRTALSDDIHTAIQKFEDAGKTTIVLVDGNAVAGIIAVRDEPREDARSGLARLAGLGIRCVMLTGDNKRTARAVAADLGIEAHAELLPDDKARIVRELDSSAQGPAGKVGDGINDAPALAAARVGIAMGSGTDVAIEAADVALLKNRVMGVAELVALSRATLANIRANVILALGSKGVFLATTVFGITGMWIAVMADTGATVLVTLNALRLMRFRFN